MKQLLLLIVITGFIACKSKTKVEATPETEKSGKDTIVAHPDTAITTGSGKIDIESFGDIKLGQHYSEVIKALGKPDSKSKATEWGADGLLHEDWAWTGKGLSLNMSSDKANVDSSLTLFSITAKSPCSFKTKSGAGIGNTYSEVQEAYKRDIDATATDKTQITVGSVYGGIIFTFKDDKVAAIFLGAAAE